MAQKWLNRDGDFRATPAEVNTTLPPGMYKVYPTLSGIVFSTAKLKTDGLVLLEESPVARVIDGIRKFWTSADTFKNLGLLHKRGVLLYGTPGGGKSAAVEILAKDVISGDGVVLLCEHPMAAMEGVKTAREVEPDLRLVVVMEDFDTWVAKKDLDSQLSNLLDGANQVEHVVYLATTNHISNVPDRYRNRPSRFDEVVEVGMPSAELRRAYLHAKLPQGTLEASELNRWVEMTDGLSIAHLRELIVGVLALGNPLTEVVARLTKMKNNSRIASGEVPLLLGKEAKA